MLIDRTGLGHGFDDFYLPCGHRSPLSDFRHLAWGKTSSHNRYFDKPSSTRSWILLCVWIRSSSRDLAACYLVQWRIPCPNHRHMGLTTSQLLQQQTTSSSPLHHVYKPSPRNLTARHLLQRQASPCHHRDTNLTASHMASGRPTPQHLLITSSRLLQGTSLPVN